MFTYRRPNEISSMVGESLLAEGPTNEILDVYVSPESVDTCCVTTTRLLTETRPYLLR